MHTCTHTHTQTHTHKHNWCSKHRSLASLLTLGVSCKPCGFNEVGTFSYIHVATASPQPVGGVEPSKGNPPSKQWLLGTSNMHPVSRPDLRQASFDDDIWCHCCPWAWSRTALPFNIGDARWHWVDTNTGRWVWGICTAQDDENTQHRVLIHMHTYVGSDYEYLNYGKLNNGIVSR